MLCMAWVEGGGGKERGEAGLWVMCISWPGRLAEMNGEKRKVGKMGRSSVYGVERRGKGEEGKENGEKRERKGVGRLAKGKGVWVWVICTAGLGD